MNDTSHLHTDPVYLAALAKLEGDGTNNKLKLSSRYSIAVLPFLNISGDPEQEYFADGIVEDLITELSRFGHLTVMSRNSSFTYKGQAVKMDVVRRDLGVDFVVEGSVRRAGGRVRITAQLIDTTSGSHLWASKYDRDMADMFMLQDEIVREIVTAVPGQIDLSMIRSARRRPTESLDAHDLLLRAWQQRRSDWGSLEAKELLEQVISVDPQYALAHAHLANWHSYSILAHGCEFEDTRKTVIGLAVKALELDPSDSTIHGLLGETYLNIGELRSARQSVIKAIEINPNSYYNMSIVGPILAYSGEINEALHWNELFLKHDPLGVQAFREVLVEVYYMAKRFEEAARVLVGWESPPPHVLAEAAAANAQAGNLAEASNLRERYFSLMPTSSAFDKFLLAQMRMCAKEELRTLWLEGYRKAGFSC